MATRRTCDRSGKDITEERPEGVLEGRLETATKVSLVPDLGPDQDGTQRRVGGQDLVILCPWLPALHGFTFEDLSTEERIKVAKYLASIAKMSGEKGLPLVFQGATGFGGEPLMAVETSTQVDASKPEDCKNDWWKALDGNWYAIEDAHDTAKDGPIGKEYAGPFGNEEAAMSYATAVLKRREAARGQGEPDGPRRKRGAGKAT